MTGKRPLRLTRRTLRQIALTLAAGAVLFAVGAQLLIGERYRSTTQIYVSPFAGSGSSPTAAVSPRELSRECLALLDTDRVVDAVASEMQNSGRTLTKSAVRRMVRASAVDGTGLIRIEVTADEATLSRTMCAAYASVASAQLRTLLRGSQITAMGDPSTGERVPAPLWQAALLGLAAAAVLLAVVLPIRARLRRIRDGESVRQLGLPLLGTLTSYVPAADTDGGADA